MKKLLLTILWIISLWLINFSSAWTYTFEWDYTFSNNSSSSISSSSSNASVFLSINLNNEYRFNAPSGWKDLNMYFSWYNFMYSNDYFLDFDCVISNSTYSNSRFPYTNLNSTIFNFDLFWFTNTSSFSSISRLVDTIKWKFAYSAWIDLSNDSCIVDNYNAIINNSSNIHSWQDLYEFTYNNFWCSPSASSSYFFSVPNGSVLDNWRFHFYVWYENNLNWVYFIFLRNSTSISATSCSSQNCNYSLHYSCTVSNPYLNKISSSSSCDYLEYENTINTLSWSLASCQSDLTSCQNDSSCTQLKCENDYQLIPESSINSEYCEDRFNLIDPVNCPVSGWTGDVQWSSFFVNNRQIQGASNIYLRMPDFLNWEFTYIDSWSTLEIDVENEGDQEYIENLLQVQTYHPSSEDFTMSFTWTITLLMPYIIISLFIIFLWKLIKRIFK